jgi:hypothetical protein
VRYRASELPHFHDSRHLRLPTGHRDVAPRDHYLHTSRLQAHQALDCHFFAVEEIDCSLRADVTPTCFAIAVYGHVGESISRHCHLSVQLTAIAAVGCAECLAKTTRIRPQMPCEEALEQTHVRRISRCVLLPVFKVISALVGHSTCGASTPPRKANECPFARRPVSRRGAIPQPRLGPARVPAMWW